MSRYRRTTQIAALAIVTATFGASLPLAAASPAPTALSLNDTVEGPPSEPTVLDEFTTETTLVTAFPDGTFELVSDRLPVRAQQDGEWVDIDTTLEPGPGGTFEPAAAAVPLSMSGGGDGPLLTIADGATEMSIHWEATLPAPVIDADSATYRNVRPDVDLVLTAQESGYGQALVIHTPAAAQALIENPATLVVTATGMTFTAGPDNTIIATAEDGTVMRSAPPMLWDSSGATEPQPDDSGDGKVRRVSADIDISGRRVEMALAPPASVLNDTTTQYPLFLDPVIDPNRNHYLTTHSKGWDYYDDDNQMMRVGYCGWTECNTSIQGNARSFFSFAIDPLSVAGSDPVIYDATVLANQQHNALSSATAVDLRKATSFSASTNYPGPVGTTLQTISSAQGYGSDPGGWLSFSNDSVKNYVQAEADNESNNIQFSLSAPAPDNKNYWKKFGRSPKLEIKYGYPPSTPTGLGATGAITCTDTNYVVATTPTLTATATHPQDYSLNYFFELYRSDGVLRAKNTDPITKGSGSPAAWTTNASGSTNTTPLPPGGYSYKVYAKTVDATVTNTPGPTSASWKFTIDQAKPAAPSVTSFAYPPGYWGATADTPGLFNLKGPTDTVGYSYSIDGGTPPSLVNTNCTYNQTTADKRAGYRPAIAGAATFTPPLGLSSGNHTLVVRGFDAAHNLSDPVTYEFFVAPTVSGFTGSNLFELENAEFLRPGGTSDPYVYKDAGATYSGGNQSRIVANHGTPGSPTVVDYKFSVPTTAYYAPGIWLNTSNHYGKIRITFERYNDTTGDHTRPIVDANGAPIVINLESTTAGSKFINLGEYLPYEGLLLDAGKPDGTGKQHALRIEIIGNAATSYTYNGTYGVSPNQISLTNHTDNGFSVGVDALSLSPLKSPPFATIADAFNNNGIGTPGTTAARFNLGTTSDALSSSALASAGITPGQPYTIGGATFQMPQHNPDGTDNVIASGQTIEVPTNNGAPFVYLLAASTCKAVQASPTRALTIKYTFDNGDGTTTTDTSDAPITSIPDWKSTPPAPTAGIPATVPLSHTLIGTNTTGPAARLYLLKFPVPTIHYDPQLGISDPITAITLPRVGTTFTNQPCTAGTTQDGTQALHILAMTTG